MCPRTLIYSLCVLPLIAARATGDEASSDDSAAFVHVCPGAPRYFELTNGKPYIPIGMNICWPRFEQDEQQVLATLDRRFSMLSANGGNYVRIWMSHPFYSIEHRRSGEYDVQRLGRIKEVLALARRHGIRVKLCIDHFRTLEDKPIRFPGSLSFGNPLQHVDRGGPASTMSEFFQSEESRARFKSKLRWLGDQLGDDPTIFAWELWNEINSVQGAGWLPWTEEMLAELHEVFPKNMAVQNLGSLDSESKLDLYSQVWRMPNNDFTQVHRYLDLGARWEVCHGPMDILAADAIRQLAAGNFAKPILLAECGAVEPHHAAPSTLYEKDAQGILLHDLIFAPFFAGSAGCGQSWHWVFYVDKHDLWYHFGRFAEAVRGIDPRREGFRPELVEDSRLRVYALKGNEMTLVWCRDKQSDWKTELVEGRAAAPVNRAVLSLADLNVPDGCTATGYDPWRNEWMTLAADRGTLSLPGFTRSIVVRLRHEQER